MEGKTPKEGFPLRKDYDTLARWDSDFTQDYCSTPHKNTHTQASTQSLPPSLGFCLKQRRGRHAKALEHENILFWVYDWTHKEASHQQGGWAEVISSPPIFCQVTNDNCLKCAAKRLNLVWHDDAILIFSLLHNTGQDVLCLFPTKSTSHNLRCSGET